MKPKQVLDEEQDLQLAPDFTLPDLNGRPVNLADYRDDKHVVLVFNRGFM